MTAFAVRVAWLTLTTTVLMIAVCIARPEGVLQPVNGPPTIADSAVLESDDAAAAVQKRNVDVDSETAAASYVLHQNEHPDDAVLSGSATGAPPNPGSETAEGSAIALEATPSYWRNIAQSTLQQHLLLQPNTNRAKNVIYFLGDGMSLPTIVAARMYLGQQQGRSGEEGRLSFEEFPYVGLSKTYCVDKQTADSACSATAYLCGVKANFETIGVTAAVQRDNCSAAQLPENRVDSLIAWAQARGKRTGVVTTTRITHASPAGAYAHSANRAWESDGDVPADAADCEDIASQLVRGPTGRRLNVILGGGRRAFLPANWTDVDGVVGVRVDGVNLVDEWMQQNNSGCGRRFVRNRNELIDEMATDGSNDGEHDVLGLFGDGDHMSYYLDADHELEPTLGEMTLAAIRRLQGGDKENRGFVLFVEGGRIDHAHHQNLARKALEETVQFSAAVQLAIEWTRREETLIVVTSDHAHTMSLSGYSKRGVDILGLNSELGSDKLPFTTLSYGTGPRMAIEANGSRSLLNAADLRDKDYLYPALVPLASAAHGGDDVGVFAIGPWAHLLSGSYEQHVIPHVIAYAACLGDGLTMCENE